MSDEAKPLPWQSLYRSALLELNHAKLAEYISAADSAIQERLRVPREQVSPQERQAIRDAQQNLRVLRQEIVAAANNKPITQVHPEMSGDYVVMVDSNRHYVAVTDGVCRLLGYSRCELLGKAIDEIAAPEIRDTVPEVFEQYVSQGGMDGNFALLSKDGRRVAIQYHARVFPDGALVARWQPLSTARNNDSAA